MIRKAYPLVFLVCLFTSARCEMGFPHSSSFTFVLASCTMDGGILREQKSGRGSPPGLLTAAA
jgi:hypothetical protein